MVAALAAGLLAVAGCSTTGGDSATTSSPSGTAATGSSAAPPPAELTIATSFGIDSLDPLTDGFWGPEFGYVELLMRPERSGTPSPWVLRELTAVDDTTWQMVLNEGISFQSGRPLDGAALAQLLNWTAENNEGFATASAFASAEATGPLEVTMTTSRPIPLLANTLADESNVLVLDVDAYEAAAPQAETDPAVYLDAGLYTGAYEMQSLDTETAVLAPDADHWGGTPALSALTIKFVPEVTARVQAVQAGEADLALYIPTSVAATLEGRDDAYYVTGQPTGSQFALQFNVRGAPTDDVLVRRALLAAVDYRALADDVLQGLASVAEGIYPPSVPWAVTTQVTDPTVAAGLLDQAGWTAGSDGTRSKDGQPLTIRMLTYPQQPDSDTLAVALQAQLAELGVQVEVNQVPDIYAAQESGEWETAILSDSLLSYGGSPVDGLADDLRTDGEQNYSGVSIPELDALIDQVQITFDPAERTELLEQVQQVVHDHAVWGALVFRTPAVVTGPQWRGYETPISNLWVTAQTAPSA
ncbi:ABC transporter substrate-binding protein [Nakamurella leprariae]|uniref:Solute-binding protein family 5 domain-containing protein n=1 Tax=Nakamurella leprariae TaxID=2803911 RepID=A0A939C0W8_9ACTN|nr:ABC transporter substrate-binding protein [Nakamurella leprariae]MBM9466572.1 hypothetical protein [Nakamurella leprariae]